MAIFHRSTKNSSDVGSANTPSATSEMVTTLIAQIVRFACPNIQIYDVHVVELDQ